MILPEWKILAPIAWVGNFRGLEEMVEVIVALIMRFNSTLADVIHNFKAIMN
jgi:transcriptional regulator with PAS, ATPase and Fis domain